MVTHVTSGGWRAPPHKERLPGCAGLNMEIGWMLYVGVSTYGREDLYDVFLSWGEGALINVQYAIQMAHVSGCTRTGCIRGSSDF